MSAKKRQRLCFDEEPVIIEPVVIENIINIEPVAIEYVILEPVIPVVIEPAIIDDIEMERIRTASREYRALKKRKKSNRTLEIKNILLEMHKDNNNINNVVESTNNCYDNIDNRNNSIDWNDWIYRKENKHLLMRKIVYEYVSRHGFGYMFKFIYGFDPLVHEGPFDPTKSYGPILKHHFTLYHDSSQWTQMHNYSDD